MCVLQSKAYSHVAQPPGTEIEIDKLKNDNWNKYLEGVSEVTQCTRLLARFSAQVVSLWKYFYKAITLLATGAVLKNFHNS